MLAHRIAYEAQVGPIPPRYEIMHACDTPACCKLDHLSAGTHAENMADMHRKGRQRKPRSRSST
jgi:hypothetical protein